MAEFTNQSAYGSPFGQKSLVSKKEWHRVVELAFREAKQKNQPLSVIFMNVGSFKQIYNIDQYDNAGSLGGLINLVINNLRARKQTNRMMDLISLPDFSDSEPRVAGQMFKHVQVHPGHTASDEFAILAHADEHGVRTILYRLIAAFEEFINSSSQADYREMGADLVIGFSTLTPDMATSTDLLKAADLSMYENRIEDWESVERLRQIMLEAGTLTLRLANVSVAE